MNSITHIKFGMAASIGAFQLASSNLIKLPIDLDTANLIAMTVGSVVGSILMDNDTKGSLISKFLPFSNKIITTLADKGKKAFYHRHLFHSLLFYPVFCLFFIRESILGFSVYSTLTTAVLCGAFIGLIFHAFADCYISNTWLLYPIVKKPFSILKLKQAEDKVRYRKVERACNRFASIMLFLLIGNYLLQKNTQMNLITIVVAIIKNYI